MGTKVHCETHLPGFYSMRDPNEDSSSSSWPLFYGGKTTIPNGQYYNGFMPRTSVDVYPTHEKDALKQKILEHEAVFKDQVCELHRLYGIQRDMMEEVKRKELYKRGSMEPASSSSLQGSQMPSADVRKWHMAGFPLLNSSYDRKPSISGVDIVNSPVSCTKGHNSTLPGHPSKDSEAFDSRPLKVRKKLFDLQLPADEYMDTEEGENLTNYKASNMPCYAPNGPPSNHIGLADLNEPVQIQEEEATGPSFGQNLGNVRTDQPTNTNAGYLGLNGETMHSRDRFLIHSNVGRKVNENGRLSHIYEAGSSSSNLSPVTHGRQPDKSPLPSHPMQGWLSQVHPPPGTYRNGFYNREDMWRHGLESSDKSRDHSINSHLEPIPSHPFFSSSCFASSWAHPVLSWAKPTSNQEPFGGKWHINATSRLSSVGFDYLNCSRGDNVASDRFANHGFGNFQKGSSHVDSKPAIDINLNEDGDSKPEEHPPSLPWLKPKLAHVNEVANTRISETSCKNEILRDLNQLFTPDVTLASSDPKIEGKKETLDTQPVKKILGFPIFERGDRENEMTSIASTSASADCHFQGKNVKNDRKNGVIDINVVCEPEDVTAAEEQTVEKENKKTGASIRDRIIDLNSCVSDCDDPPPPCHERKSTNVKITLEIDLEVPVFLESEDDDTPAKENIPDEVPLENKNEQTQDEVLRNAAEAIVSISSSCQQIHVDKDSNCQPSEASLTESLLWFVDAVSSYANELETGKRSGIIDGLTRQDSSSEDEIDDFEAMTLQLPETKEEDYMPKPFVPEFPKTEDVGPNTLPIRPRRGQSRRGRQRRDFQRDILPGLASLSRHEVTEDLQIFGGVMRATGHSWNSGLARRNGSGRGRRRAVVEVVPAPAPSPVCSTPLIQQLNNIEAGLEDRSLTGWGKTTRRPRRQRCPAGNNAHAVVLT